MNWKQKLEAHMNCTNAGGRLQGHALIDACRILDIKPRTIAEIGVYKGQTTRQLSHAFVDAALTLVDPWEAQDLPGKMYKRHTAEDWEAIYQGVCEEFAGETIVRTDSLTAAYMMQPESFDLVFLDGDHDYHAVSKDIIVWAAKVKTGGLLCGHDYSTQGSNKGVKKAVDEILGDDIVVGSRKTWVHRIGG